MKPGPGILVALVTALAAAQVSAHHTGTYRENQTITIEGELARLQIRNPHSFVHVVVKDRRGNEVPYTVEWASAGRLEDQGVTNQTLKIGDHVVVTGYPAQDSRDRRVRMVTLRRPRDNYNYNYDGR